MGQCAVNHDATELLSLPDRCHKQTDHGLGYGYHLYTDDLLWRNFLSPQCRNCSRDHDHAHLGNTHSSKDEDFAWPTRVQNLKSLVLASAEMLHGVGVKFYKGSFDPDHAPFRKDFLSAGWDLV